MARKPESDSQLRIRVEGDLPSGGAGPVPSSRKTSTRAERQEFFLPVSGFVWLYPEEVKIVNHPAFQRLGRVYQLGQTYFVYRGATHKRFEHVLGTLAVVQRMIDAVHHNSEKSADLSALGESEIRFTRLGALLHDIGHMAAGHTVEDELGLVGRHDADERLQTVFEGEDWKDLQGRTLASLIDTQFDLYVPSELADKGVTAAQLVRLLIRKTPSSKGPEPLGSTRTNERILQYMEIRKQAGVGVHNGPSFSFVISLGRRPKIRTDAISNILELLEWRYQLAESVLFHRTKLAASAMLDRALYEL
jgi:HD superfamily phosphohydrolase